MDNARPSRSSLPREFCDHVIDLLASSTSPAATTTQSLRACSVASRALHTRAYHHLFSTLSIQVDTSESTENSIVLLTSLRELLQDSVHFPDVGFVYHLQAFTLGVDVHLHQCYPIFERGRVGDILNALHGEGYGVLKLKLSMDGYCREEFSIADLDSLSLTGFVGLCRSPNLRHLSLAGMKGLPRVVFRGCNLDHLELIRVGVLDAHVYSEGEPNLAHVRKITMDSKVPILDLAYSLEDANVPDVHSASFKAQARSEAAFASLTDLRINFTHFDQVPDALSVAAHAATSLSSLHISILGPSSPTAPTHLFHPLIALHTLKITKQGSTRPLNKRRIVDPLWLFLDTCTLPPNLHALIVGSMALRILSATTVGRQEEQEDRPHKAEWAGLDGVLCDAPFIRVPKIVMCIEYVVYAVDKLEADRDAALRDFDEDAFRARARGLVADALPRLRSSRSKPSLTDCPRPLEVDIAIIRRQPWTKKIKVNFGGPMLVA